MERVGPGSKHFTRLVALIANPRCTGPDPSDVKIICVDKHTWGVFVPCTGNNEMQECVQYAEPDLEFY